MLSKFIRKARNRQFRVFCILVVKWEELWRGSRGELKDSNLFCLMSEPIMWLTFYICMLAYRSLLLRLCEIHGIIGIGYCEWSDYVLIVNSYLIRTEVLMVICWTQYMSYRKWYWVHILHLIPYVLKGMVWPMCLGMCNSIENIDYTRK